MTQAPETPSNGKKVLCIEDEYFISELYERALHKAGYSVTTVLNGIDGLQLAQTNRYDIILLDLMVPSITGIEILRALRNPEVTPGFAAKVVITTNLDQDDEMKAEVEQLADGYLIKAAFTPKELVAYLDKLQF